MTADVSRNARERLAGAGISKIVGKLILIKNLRDALEDDRQEGSDTVRLAAGTLIDERFLNDQRELLGAQRIAELCELLEETSETLVAHIIRAAAADDRAQLAKCAHRLGSAASALGLVRLFEACNAIELTSMSTAECRIAARELETLRQASLHALPDPLRREARVSAGVPAAQKEARQPGRAGFLREEAP